MNVVALAKQIDRSISKLRKANEQNDKVIANLEKVKLTLSKGGNVAKGKPGRPVANAPKKSTARLAGKAAKPAVKTTKVPAGKTAKPTGVSNDARKRISDAQKLRWAKVRKAKKLEAAAQTTKQAA